MPRCVRVVSVVSATVSRTTHWSYGEVGLPRPAPSRAGSARDLGAERRAPRRFLGGGSQHRAPCSECRPFEDTSGVAPTVPSARAGLRVPTHGVQRSPATKTHEPRQSRRSNHPVPDVTLVNP